MNQYICKKCGGSMWEEERVGDTEKADVDIEVAVVCQECGHEFIKTN